MKDSNVLGRCHDTTLALFPNDNGVVGRLHSRGSRLSAHELARRHDPCCCKFLFSCCSPLRSLGGPYSSISVRQSAPFLRFRAHTTVKHPSRRAVSILGMAVQHFLSSLLVLYTLIGLSIAQLPTVWKPSDVVTFFCSRWYHQCRFWNTYPSITTTDMFSCCQE